MDMFSMMKFMMGRKKDPQQLAMSILKDNCGDNPVVNNLIDMAQKGDTKGIEKFARNFCNSRGGDFDKEFSEFMKKIDS